jgi:type I restriction enzyme S subunit
MKKDWAYKKLVDVCGIQYGYPFDSKCFTEDNTYPALIRIRDVVRGYTETFYKGDIPEEYYVQEGEYLIGMDGEFNIAPWRSEKALLNQRVCKIFSITSNVDIQFVYYSLQRQLKQIEDETPFVTVKHLSAKRLNQVEIPIPPLSIQRSIVAELDLLHSVISNKKEQLRELDNLAQSLFYQMFGDESQWESATLKEVCSSIVRGPFGSALKKDFFVPKNDTTYKVYEQKHAIQKDAFIGSYYITKEKFAELKRFEVFPNDIIMSCSGTIGELFVIPNGAEKGVMNQALLKFHLNELITIPYFMFIMEYVKGKMTIQGCGLQNIGSVKEICKIDFPLPPLSLQQSFAAKVSAIEAQKQAVQQSIREVEALLAERMDNYFS